MPTLFRVDGFRFFFYSNEGFEPCHIHAEGYGGRAKFWIPSGAMANSYNLNARQLKRVCDIINKNKQRIQEAWGEHFDR